MLKNSIRVKGFWVFTILTIFLLTGCLSSGGGGGAPPVAPTGITASSGNGELTVTWNEVSGASSYNLYYASVSGVTKTNYAGLPNGATSSGVTTPHIITGLIDGTTYYLVVTAVNAYGESIESAEVTATFQDGIPLDTSDIRTYQQGDSLTGNITFQNTVTGLVATGEVTVTAGVIVPNPFGMNCRERTISGTITGPLGTLDILTRKLFYQDTNNSLYECGQFNEVLGKYVFLTDTATTPNGVFLELESPVQLGNSTSGVMSFDDGTWEDCTNTVQAKENVSVPLGLYESYRMYETCSYSNGATLVNTVWRVPSIFNLKESGIEDGISKEFVVTSYSYK